MIRRRRSTRRCSTSPIHRVRKVIAGKQKKIKKKKNRLISAEFHLGRTLPCAIKFRSDFDKGKKGLIIPVLHVGQLSFMQRQPGPPHMSRYLKHKTAVACASKSLWLPRPQTSKELAGKDADRCYSPLRLIANWRTAHDPRL